MKRRKWTAEQKLEAVMAGIRGQGVADICNRFEISQSLYYKWRDQFMANATKAMAKQDETSAEIRLKHENMRLKQMVAELSLELKKSEGLGW